VTSPSGKPIIGMAGGIGSGKSHVARQLGELGCFVIDADAIAKASLDRDDVKAQIAEWWGEGVLDDSGRVDRRQLANRVFEGPDAESRRARLEGLIHPIVAAERERLIGVADRDPEVKAIVLDVPLLYEVGLDEACDSVIFVDADRAKRIERVRTERGWSANELERREKRQMPLDTKKRLAHNVFINDSESDRTEHLRDLLSRILMK